VNAVALRPASWPGPAPAARVHADRERYQQWLLRHVTPSVRYNRLHVYDAFTRQWPSLEEWFRAPLAERVTDPLPYGGPGHSSAHILMPYLAYLSLVEGTGIDYDLLLARTFASPFTTRTYPSGLGVDLAAFASHQDRLVRLGYAPASARGLLSWGLGRLLLHRGDPNLEAITADDLTEFYAAVRSFVARPDAGELRAPYARGGPSDPAGQHYRTAMARLYATHMLLFDIGQVGFAPPGGRDRDDWASPGRMVPASAPPRIAAVVERYLQLKLEANLDRPQTVRLARDALRRLLAWLAEAHPEVQTLAELTREHAEEFLRWLGTQRNKWTGEPLALTTRRSVITLITGFVADTASWKWADVPGRVIFTRADIPKYPKPLPR
jgi:hypothetical protein